MNPVRAGVLAGLTVVTSAAVEFGPPVLAVPAGLLLAFVLHSRVARSDIHALITLGVPEVRVIGPHTLLASNLDQMGV
ncbi:MAG TPA: hypothetical protein VN408_03470, partial [Actinoplanes sp.]|nr:hypothetical protein [Actinoplanes sp.]